MTDNLSSQWHYFLKNLGEWHGSFTQFSPQGESIQDTPSVLSLVGSDRDRHIHLTLRYLPGDRPASEMNLDFFENVKLPNQLLFFEDGSFSQGSGQRFSGSPLVGEFGLIAGERRLRIVMQFARNNCCDRLTLIRERLAGSDRPERPPLTLQQLWGEWRGEAKTLYPDSPTPVTYATHLTIEPTDSQHLLQTLTFGMGEKQRTITSTARIEGSRLLFDGSRVPVQVLLLPDGASVNCPLQIQPDRPFVLETGWLFSPQRRRRLIRSYNAQGKWVSLTLVDETKT